MGFLIIAIAVTYAIKCALDKGKAEYGYTRDKKADEFARANPDWSPGRVRRHAKRAARGYWWDQIRNGFPEAKNAYRENRDLAEATRVEAETAGMRRRAEVRARIRKALEEADRIRTEERDRFYGDDEPLPERPKPAVPESTPAPETAAAPDPVVHDDSPYVPGADGNADDEQPPPHLVDYAKHTKCRDCGGEIQVSKDLERPGRWIVRTTHTDENCPQNPERPTSREHGQKVADPEDAEVFPFKRPAPERDAEPTTGDTPEMTDNTNRNGASGETIESLKAWSDAGQEQAKLDAWADDALRRTEAAERRNPRSSRVNQPADPGQRGTPRGSYAPTGGGSSPTMSGEVHGGYEQILAGYSADVERLEGDDAIYEQQISALQQIIERKQDADAGYERRMAGLRAMNADDETVTNDAHTREANENGLHAANAALEEMSRQREANRIQLAAAIEARDSWQSRHGAVYEAKTSTGAAGDEALYR